MQVALSGGKRKYWIGREVNTIEKKKKILLILQDIGKKLNIQTLRDWLYVSHKDFRRHGGGNLLNIHKGSLFRLLKTTFTNYNWDEEIFERKRLPKGFWNSIENQRTFCDYFAQKNDIKSLDEWYSVRREDLVSQGASRLLFLYQNDVIKLLQTIYPEKDWNIYERSILPHNYWNSIENQKLYLDYLYQKLNFKSLEDFYQLNYSVILAEGGSGLLNKYNGSLFQAVQSLYPDYQWDYFKSNSRKWNFIQSNIRLLLIQLQKTFKITKKSDWYRISNMQLLQLSPCGSSIVLNGGLRKLLNRNYPEERWPKSLFSFRDKKSFQRLLYVYTASSFPSYHLIENYLHNDIRFCHSGS